MFIRLSKNDWYIVDKLADTHMSILSESIKTINKSDKSIFNNNNLAGQIDDEYIIDYSDIIKDYIFDSVRRNTKVDNDQKFEFRNKGDSWINFQKKYEYNPLHRHSGDYSFVIWYKIPYLSRDEFKLGPGKNNKFKSNGAFSFVYNSDNNEILTKIIPCDESDEGKLLIFPSSLSHCVYPFYTSDEERITLSGNFYKKNKPTTII